MKSPKDLPIRDSKYVRHYKFFDDHPMIYTLYQQIETFRWKLNRFLLYQPFHCCAKIDCNITYCEYNLLKCKCSSYKYYLNQYIYLSTIGEIILWFIIIAMIAISIPLMLQDGKNAGKPIGSFSEIFFLIAWFLGQRNTLWNLFFGLSFGMYTVLIH